MANDVADRRIHKRFPLRLNVTYAPASKRRTHVNSGTGCTIDISRTAVSFESELPMPVGCKLKLCIDLPIEPNSKPRRLTVDGSVVRASGTRSVVLFSSYRFVANSLSEVYRDEYDAPAVVSVRNEEDAAVITSILRQHSLKVVRLYMTADSLLRRSPGIRLVVTDDVEPFLSMAMPVLWINAPADAATKLADKPNVTILEPDYPLRKLLHFLNQLIDATMPTTIAR